MCPASDRFVVRTHPSRFPRPRGGINGRIKFSRRTTPSLPARGLSGRRVRVLNAQMSERDRDR
eukprot:7569499-Pyramimonas_sp.AAC.1